MQNDWSDAESEQLAACQREAAELRRELDGDTGGSRDPHGGREAMLAVLAGDEPKAGPEVADLQALHVELAAQREALSQQRRRWEAEYRETGQRLDVLAERVNHLMTELQRPSQPPEIEPAQSDDNDRQPEETTAAQTTAAPAANEESALAADPPTPPKAEAPTPEAPKPEAPVNLAEIFQRMKLEVDEDEERATHLRPTRPTRVEPEPVAPPAVEHSSGGNGDEESIDDYMARLLSRVRDGSNNTELTGASRPAAPAPSRAVPQRPTAPPPSAAAHAPPNTTSSTPVAVRRQPPQKMTPRAVAPEKQVNFSAMRELANLSAQAAITRYANRQLLTITRTKLAFAVTGLAVGSILIWMWVVAGGKAVNLYGSIGSFLVALLWGGQYVVLSCRALLRRMRHRRQAEAVATAEALAAAASPEPAEAALEQTA